MPDRAREPMTPEALLHAVETAWDLTGGHLLEFKRPGHPKSTLDLEAIADHLRRLAALEREGIDPPVYAVSNMRQQQRIFALERENEALMDAINNELPYLRERMAAREEAIAALEAENARYREALERLARNEHSYQEPAGEIARAALDAFRAQGEATE